MEWLNYHHLLYFWVVSREGSIVKATERLHVAQPTISGQIRQLEKAFGEKLFTRVGRNLALTETGRVVQRYADEIFGIGQEMLQALKRQSVSGRQIRVTIGIADVVPKLIGHHLVEAVFGLAGEVHVTCLEGSSEALLGELAQHNLDVVISDAPIPPLSPGPPEIRANRGEHAASAGFFTPLRSGRPNTSRRTEARSQNSFCAHSSRRLAPRLCRLNSSGRTVGGSRRSWSRWARAVCGTASGALASAATGATGVE